MTSDADEALTGIEEKMVELVDREYERLRDNDSAPLPMTLVALMKNTHGAILARLGKRGGFDMAAMAKNPEAALVMLDRTKSLLLRMIEQQRTKQPS